MLSIPLCCTGTCGGITSICSPGALFGGPPRLHYLPALGILTPVVEVLLLDGRLPAIRIPLEALRWTGLPSSTCRCIDKLHPFCKLTAQVPPTVRCHHADFRNIIMQRRAEGRPPLRRSVQSRCLQPLFGIVNHPQPTNGASVRCSIPGVAVLTAQLSVSVVRSAASTSGGNCCMLSNRWVSPCRPIALRCRSSPNSNSALPAQACAIRTHGESRLCMRHCSIYS